VFHGGVGNIDIERILIEDGFTPIVFPYQDNFSLQAKFFRYLHVLKILLSLPAGSLLFFQFPLHARMHKLLLRLLRVGNRTKIICLIADINGLKDADDLLLKQEIKQLRSFRYFIVHGKPMEAWLKEHIPHAITSRLYFFDFLTTATERAADKHGRIVFAGNLIKSRFIHDLHLVAAKHDLHFNIYGPDPGNSFNNQTHVHYKGVYDPYLLPAVIEGAYGLLWDGDSIHGAGGNYGSYMQYISHHKLSLYVLAGLPLIVFDQAGTAEMVRSLNIGIAVKSLDEIGEKLARLSDADYIQMQENMKPIARRIAKGENLKAAIAALLEVMEK
jgi:hypothetical protein